MLNLRLIAHVISSLLLLEAILLSSAFGVGLYYNETDYTTFGIPIAITLLLAIILFRCGRKAVNKLGRRDGYLIISSTWIIFSIIGMLPFLIGGSTSNVAHAFFETMSGFTTTGASIFTNIDALPHSILFWRSMTHWIGGMGIVFFTVAILPTIGSGDQKLFSAESTGLKIGKLHPKISTTARWMWSLYLIMTIACTTAYHLGGMDMFDAINHAFSTVATGGFSTHQASMAYFNSPTIEYISIAFMFLASINFTLLYLFVIKFRFREVLKDAELRFFTCTVLLSTVFVAGTLIVAHEENFSGAIRNALFNVVSISSTTGFTTNDFMMWHPCVWMVITMIGVMGACAGSTSGGLKSIRVLTAYKISLCEFRRTLHPKAVFPVRINHTIITNEMSRTIFVYFAICAGLLVLGTGILAALGIPMLDAVGLSISSFSNIGPTLGHAVGPLDSWDAIPDVGLWVCSFLMLAGRLEIFSLLLPFFPDFWKEN